MNILKKQLEILRVERALQVAESIAHTGALLTTAELARINQIVTGQSSVPWRENSTPSTFFSQKESFSLVSNPKQIAREKLHKATSIAETGDLIDATVEIYTDLILSQVFLDGNYRTAMIASHYFLKRYRSPLSGMDLYNLRIGDLRQERQVEALKELIRHMTKFFEKRPKK